MRAEIRDILEDKKIEGVFDEVNQDVTSIYYYPVFDDDYSASELVDIEFDFITVGKPLPHFELLTDDNLDIACLRVENWEILDVFADIIAKDWED